MINHVHIKPGDICISRPHKRGILYLFDNLKQSINIDMTKEVFTRSTICCIMDNNLPVMFLQNMHLKIDDFTSNARSEKYNTSLMNRDVWKVLIGEKVYLAGFDNYDWNAYVKL